MSLSLRFSIYVFINLCCLHRFVPHLNLLPTCSFFFPSACRKCLPTLMITVKWVNWKSIDTQNLSRCCTRLFVFLHLLGVFTFSQWSDSKVALFWCFHYPKVAKGHRCATHTSNSCFRFKKCIVCVKAGCFSMKISTWIIDQISAIVIGVAHA